MKMLASSYPLLMREGANFRVHITGSVLPAATIEAETLAECEAKLSAYAETVKATGNPALVSAIAHPRNAGRKIRGFDAWANEKEIFVNEDAIVADAA